MIWRFKGFFLVGLFINCFTVSTYKNKGEIVLDSCWLFSFLLQKGTPIMNNITVVFFILCRLNT